VSVNPAERFERESSQRLGGARISKFYHRGYAPPAVRRLQQP